MYENRTIQLKAGTEKKGPVLYWMSRDQRVRDNWALLFAQKLSLDKKSPLSVAFNLAPSFLGATIRHYGFMLKGLGEVEYTLAGLNVPFFILLGEPSKTIPALAREIGASAVVTDFNPLRLKKEWKRKISSSLTVVPFYEVDAHNIVPYFRTSKKLEFAARTIRPKITRLLPEFLHEFPIPVKMPKSGFKASPIDWTKIMLSLEVDRKVAEISDIKPGEQAAAAALGKFVSQKLALYPEARNDPTIDGQSGLSPYIHFGQLSAQRVALAVRKSRAPKESKSAFLEELIVRRELSDNFCAYNESYDSFEGFPAWSKKTLDQHRRDPREYVYNLKTFESATTHDELWNAAQIEMARTGKMHGFMRMYWAKKILEWSESPEQALETAIFLNDRYELDGRDPNGYVGCTWSIGGVHDRPWFERAVYGKVRYMSADGAARKFKVESYINANGVRS